jgi:hypothetical protein
MKQAPRLTVFLAAMLVVAACGDDDAATTTLPGVTTTAAVTTTAGEATTTTGVTEPLGEFLTAGVADPFFDSGYHPMQWAGDAHEFLESVDTLPGGGRLGLGPVALAGTTGLEPDQRLVAVWVEGSVDDFAVALYRLGPAGWAPVAVFLNTATLGFLETTTDYLAKQPAGPAILHVFPSAFSWDGSTARLIAGVEVYDDLEATNVVYTGEVDCAITPEGGGCILLSDDGVLRPGDESDAVQLFEEDLAAIGYFPYTPDTIYDATTDEQVRIFQRDYRLTIDGKAGPQTIALADDILSGVSDIVMAHPEGVQGVSFASLVEDALPALIELLGPPDYTLGWEMGACGPTPPYGGWEWYKVTWGGFTAWFTEKSGNRAFDGWEVTDLSDVPADLYFVGGIAPGWNLGQVKALGGSYDEFYGWWYLGSLDYRQGTLVGPYGNPPANSTKLLGWGVGTAGVLYDC